MSIKGNSTIRIRIACFIAVLLLTSAVAAYTQDRMVAVGDVHGANEEFVSILQRTGLIDGNRKWVGGSAVLVQTGDLLDRGNQSRECIDLLMGIERQAAKAGGRVIPLLGNHEVLNIVGDMRYVAADSYRSFITSRSDKRREQAYRDYLKFLSAHRNHSHANVSTDDEASREKWLSEHPPGFFEYRDAIGPSGKYGAWFRMHNIIARVGDGLFVHGGLNPMLQFQDIAELNGRIHSELASFDLIWQSLVRKKVIWRYMKLEEAMRQVNEELMWMQAQGKVENPEIVQQMRQLLDLNQWMVFSQEGPLWYRGLALGREENLMDALKAMLARLDAQYIVAGHTVLSKSAITTRFDNRVFLIDTGMLKEAYGGRASALEIQNGQFTAHYADGESKVLVEPGRKNTALPAIPKE